MNPASPFLPLLQAFAKRFEALDTTHPFYAKRQQAWNSFQTQGLPTLKTELYKYTPITDALVKVFNKVYTSQTTPLSPEAVASVLYPDLNAYQVVLLNGQLSKEYSRLAGLETDIQVFTFAEAYQQQYQPFLAYLARNDPSTTDPFANLNTALFEGGICIYLAEHVVLEKPLLLCHVADARTQQTVTNPRILIFGGKNSHAHIITAWTSLGTKPNFTNAMVEVMAAQSAHINYYTLQTNTGQQAYHINTVQCQQAQGSVLNTYTFTWEGALVRNNLTITSNAAHTETNMYGLYYLHGKQHVDNYTQVTHCQPHTHSNELYKGIVTDEAVGAFNGRIYVRAEAQKTNAFQANQNIVLSDQAAVYTKPQLEIWADDVKCSHGATIGQLDKEQLFYLQARGLHKEMALRLLLQAFANEVIDKVSLPSLRDYLCAHLALRLS